MHPLGNCSLVMTDNSPVLRLRVKVRSRLLVCILLQGKPYGTNGGCMELPQAGLAIPLRLVIPGLFRWGWLFLTCSIEVGYSWLVPLRLVIPGLFH